MNELNFPEASYTSPSGNKFSFLYDAVSKETDLKTATFTFPEKDGAYVQSLGRGGRRFPLTCIFSGFECQKNADEFEKALEERGVGTLHHPVYGERNVVPTGSIKREDGVVDSINEITIEIVFSETIVDEEMLQSVPETSDELEHLADDFVEKAVNEFADNINVEKTADAMALVTTMKENQKIVADTVEKIISDSSRNNLDVFKNKINSVYKKINNVVKEASSKISEIQEYGFGLFKLMRLPSKIYSSTFQICRSCEDMIISTIKMFTKDPVGINKIKNNYFAAKMTAEAGILAICESCVFSCGNSGFNSREEAIAAAETIQNVSECFNDFCDSKIEKDLFISAEDSYADLLSIEQKTIALILNTAFSLKKRRIIKLDRDRQIIELLYELYGDIDSHLDEFISDNKLNINTIAILPMGMEVAYYV